MKGTEIYYRDQHLLSVIFYEGPWERLSNWCYGLRRDSSLRWDIPANPRGWRWLLSKAGDWADRHDRPWHDKYLLRGSKPPDRWKRRIPDEAR